MILVSRYFYFSVYTFEKTALAEVKKQTIVHLRGAQQKNINDDTVMERRKTLYVKRKQWSF